MPPQKTHTDPLVPKKKKNSFFGHVSQKTLILFTKNLSILLKSGSTLSDSLKVLRDQAKGKFKIILDDISTNTEGGVSLHEALQDHSTLFDNMYVNIVKIGEESGTLEQNIAYLANQLGKNYALKKQIMGAMLYPIIIFSGTIVLAAGMAIFVLPKISGMFKNFNTALPLSTRALIALSDFLQTHGILSALIACGALVFLLTVPRLPFIKPYSHRLILRLPIVSGISRNINLTMFYRSLSILLRSGITIDKAIKICGSTLRNKTYGTFLKNAYTNIKSGESLYSILKTTPHLFPSTDCQIINVGEESGTLSDSLTYTAEVHEDDLNETTKNLTAIMEPVLFIFIGLMVGILALSIIAPIYSITQQFDN